MDRSNRCHRSTEVCYPLILVTLLCAGSAAGGVAVEPEVLPIDLQALTEMEELTGRGVRNALTLDQLDRGIRSADGFLEIDFHGIDRLLDGSVIDPSRLYGSAQAGPYPFEGSETRFAYKRFRARCRIRDGRGELKLQRLLEPKANSEGWTDGGRVCIRFDLHLEREGRDRDLGVYDTFVAFRVEGDRVEKLPTLIEGPLVGLLQSDDPSRVVITLTTDRPTRPQVILDDGSIFAAQRRARHHEIEVTGLKAGESCRYRVAIGETTTRLYNLTAAPRVGEGPVTFAYAGDTRAGMGGGMSSYMGHNQVTLERLTSIGDRVSGYTSDRDDFRTQLTAWKQTVAGYWNERPIYPCIGNHDALMRIYEQLEIDRWPYPTDSAEAVWAEIFTNPGNAPVPSDPRRPSYQETVYAFTFGPVRVIAFNNNYWYADPASLAGGCPEGYLFSDQLEWISKQIHGADRDPRVRYIILYAQEPVFPCGGHIGDAMWYGGDNRIRAYSVPLGKEPGGGVVAETKGILEVRNELVRRIASSPKVAAVLAGDEHAYNRVLIDSLVPVGDPIRDDRNGNGRIGDAGETISPLRDLHYPVWYLTSGGGGATYYSEQPTPWTEYWEARGRADGQPLRFRYSSQENFLLFQADEQRITVEVVNPYGETIDSIPDLLEVKRGASGWGLPDSRR